MRIHRARAGFEIALLLVLLSSVRYELTAQERPNSGQTVIQSGAAEVLVDVVVTDRKNRVVTDLTQGDFQVREDEVPQGITSFHLYRGTPRTVTPSEDLLSKSSRWRPRPRPTRNPA